MSYDDWKTTDREGDEQAGIEHQEDLEREKAAEDAALTEYDRGFRDGLNHAGEMTAPSYGSREPGR